MPTIHKLKAGQPWLVEQNQSNVHTIRFEGIQTGWEQWVLLTGDRHHDNVHSRHELEIEHLEQAKARNAPIVDIGDLFCAMQGKFDPRADQSQLRPEDRGNAYFDLIGQHAAEFYAPYAKLFAVLGHGNHETATLKHHNIDLTDRLVAALNQRGGRVHTGGYGGWIRFQFVMWSTQMCAINLKYHHGAGGGGPVTRGIIDSNRQMVYLPDADMIVNGHVHEQMHVTIARERLTQQGYVSRDIVHFLRTGTYKDEYGDGSGGFHIERGRPPKPLGATWLRFYLRDRASINEHNGKQIDVDVVLSTR